MDWLFQKSGQQYWVERGRTCNIKIVKKRNNMKGEKKKKKS